MTVRFEAIRITLANGRSWPVSDLKKPLTGLRLNLCLLSHFQRFVDLDP